MHYRCVFEVVIVRLISLFSHSGKLSSCNYCKCRVNKGQGAVKKLHQQPQKEFFLWLLVQFFFHCPLINEDSESVSHTAGDQPFTAIVTEAIWIWKVMCSKRRERARWCTGTRPRREENVLCSKIVSPLKPELKKTYAHCRWLKCPQTDSQKAYDCSSAPLDGLERRSWRKVPRPWGGCSR